MLFVGSLHWQIANKVMWTSWRRPQWCLWRVNLNIRPIRRAPYGPLWANMTSSTKPEVYALSPEEDRVTATRNKCRKCREVWNAALRYMHATGQTDIHTDTLITILRILIAGEVIAYNQSICLAVFSGPGARPLVLWKLLFTTKHC